MIKDILKCNLLFHMTCLSFSMRKNTMRTYNFQEEETLNQFISRMKLLEKEKLNPSVDNTDHRKILIADNKTFICCHENSNSSCIFSEEHSDYSDTDSHQRNTIYIHEAENLNYQENGVNLTEGDNYYHVTTENDEEKSRDPMCFLGGGIYDSFYTTKNHNIESSEPYNKIKSSEPVPLLHYQCTETKEYAYTTHNDECFIEASLEDNINYEFKGKVFGIKINFEDVDVCDFIIIKNIKEFLEYILEENTKGKRIDNIREKSLDTSIKNQEDEENINFQCFLQLSYNGSDKIYNITEKTEESFRLSLLLLKQRFLSVLQEINSKM